MADELPATTPPATPDPVGNNGVLNTIDGCQQLRNSLQYWQSMKNELSLSIEVMELNLAGYLAQRTRLNEEIIRLIGRMQDALMIADLIDRQRIVNLIQVE